MNNDEQTSSVAESAPCGIQDHRWELRLECGSYSIYCMDPCEPDVVDAMSRDRVLPACQWVSYSADYSYWEIPVIPVFDRGSPDWETGIYDDPQMTFKAVEND